MLKKRHYRALSLFIAALLLAGCSSTPDIPAFTASGYLADRGAVRIWRKNDAHQAIHIRTAYTPFNGDAMEFSDYSWRQGKLLSMERHVKGAQPDDVTLRFDEQGSLNFMQRQLDGRREAVNSDAVELYTFDAQRMLNISDALLSGRVFLHQGHWLGGRDVQSCEGTRVTPDFDADTLSALAQQQRTSTSPLTIAWLEAPEGIQLLRVSHEDDCSWQPQEADF